MFYIGSSAVYGKNVPGNDYVQKLKTVMAANGRTAERKDYPRINFNLQKEKNLFYTFFFQ